MEAGSLVGRSGALPYLVVCSTPGTCQDLGSAESLLSRQPPEGSSMRTTLASFCVLGLMMGCERKVDNDAAAQIDRSSADTAVVSAAAADTSADAKLDWGPPPPG